MQPVYVGQRCTVLELGVYSSWRQEARGLISKDLDDIGLDGDVRLISCTMIQAIKLKKHIKGPTSEVSVTLSVSPSIQAG